MAILNGIEGRAHVEVKDGVHGWSGHILLDDPDPTNIRYFDAFGPLSNTTYEGPLLMEGNYFSGNGPVKILSVYCKTDEPTEFRVDFMGTNSFVIVKPLSSLPEDFLP